MTGETTRIEAPMPANAGGASRSINQFTWIWVGLAFVFLVSGLIAPGTLRLGSILAMLPFAAMLAIVSVGQTIVIQQRGLDMSCAGIVSLASILVAKAEMWLGASGGLGVLATLVVCCLIGGLNGFLVARLRISPIVATLATGALVLGVARLITDGSALPVLLSLQEFTHYNIAGLPLTVILAALLVLVVAICINGTVIGRRYVAVGANPDTAHASGVSPLPFQLGTYVVAAACYAVAGILVAGFIGYASPTSGNDYLLPSIAAVVVGGTPFTGGRGSVVASAAAALFMTQLGQMVLALGAGPAEQLLVQALVIVAAASMQHIPIGRWMMHRRRARRPGEDIAREHSHPGAEISRAGDGTPELNGTKSY